MPSSAFMPNATPAPARTGAGLHPLLERSLQPVRRPLSDGTRLFNEGDPGSTLYYVVSGEVALVLSTEQGVEIEVERRRCGSLVGAECLFSGQYGTSAVAAGACCLARMGRDEVLACLDREPAVARALLRTVLGEVVDLQQRLLDQGGRCAIGRLATFLLRESERDGDRLVYRLPWGSKQRLARQLCIKQETLSRVFQALGDRGAIRVEAWGLVILDAAILERIRR